MTPFSTSKALGVLTAEGIEKGRFWNAEFCESRNSLARVMTQRRFEIVTRNLSALGSL